MDADAAVRRGDGNPGDEKGVFSAYDSQILGKQTRTLLQVRVYLKDRAAQRLHAVPTAPCFPVCARDKGIDAEKGKDEDRRDGNRQHKLNKGQTSLHHKTRYQ